MNPQVWAKLKALRPSAPRLLWASSRYDKVTNPLTLAVVDVKTSIDGTYRQPDNNRRLKRLAIRDHGFRQFKKQGVLRQYNLAKKEASHV